MWAAKLEGEGSEMVLACEAMADAMRKVGMSIDGGKDSLSMAASVPLRDDPKKSGIFVFTILLII